jgi:beta-N-acetylhexosaminidase
VVGNTDFTSGVVDTTTGPDSPYLKSFQTAIKAGVPFVMVALATYTRIDPHHLAAFSSRVIRGLLRQQLHFTGVVVSDDLGAAAAVAGLSPATRGIDFLTAGGDLITSAEPARGHRHGSGHPGPRRRRCFLPRHGEVRGPAHPRRQTGLSPHAVQLI